MWIFDRSLTEFEKNVPIFIDTIAEHKFVQKVFEELSIKFGRPIESIRNTYASPIFRLGIAYKININRLSMGQVSIKPIDHSLLYEEYRLTETARLFIEEKIPKETFFLANVIRFQALNSSLQRNYFEQLLRVNNKVLPLLLCLQVLRELQSIDVKESYITFNELSWLTEKTSQSPIDITNYAQELILSRSTTTPLAITLPSSTAYVDAWFNLFQATRVVIDRRQISIGGGNRIRALVLNAERSMIVDKILSNPPNFIPLLNFEERFKWAIDYIKTPENLNDYLPPKEPLILKVDIPASSVFNSVTDELSVPWTLAASFKSRNERIQENKKGTLIALGIQVTELNPSVVYEVIAVNYPGDGTGKVKLSPAIKSVNLNQNISLQIDQHE